MAAVIASNSLMQMPPDALDRIGLGRVFRQVVQDYAAGMLGQIIANEPAIVKAGIVANHVDHAVGTESATKILQVGHEQLGIASPTGCRQEQPARSPVERPGQVAFFIIAGGDHLCLLTAPHPARADFGIQMPVNLIFKDRSLVRWQTGQQLTNSPQFHFILRIAGTEYRSGTTPHKFHPMPAPTDKLPNRSCVLSPKVEDSHPWLGP